MTFAPLLWAIDVVSSALSESTTTTSLKASSPARQAGKFRISFLTGTTTVIGSSSGSVTMRVACQTAHRRERAFSRSKIKLFDHFLSYRFHFANYRIRDLFYRTMVIYNFFEGFAQFMNLRLPPFQAGQLSGRQTRYPGFPRIS